MFEFLKDDVKLIEGITGYSVKKLIGECNPSWLSTDRLIFNREMNKKGLQLLRCVLSRNMNEERQNVRLSNYDEKMLADFRRDGCLILDNIFSEKDIEGETLKVNDDFKNIVRMTLGDDTIPNFQHLIVQRMPATRPYYDVQTESHFDTFHPTCKVWVYLHDVGMENAPLHFAKGTHINDEKRLRFMYELSLKLDEIKEGDFRDFKHEFDEPLPILGKKFTAIFVDVAAFHKRGIGKDGKFRVSGRGDIPRKNPFRSIHD